MKENEYIFGAIQEETHTIGAEKAVYPHSREDITAMNWVALLLVLQMEHVEQGEITIVTFDDEGNVITKPKFYFQSEIDYIKERMEQKTGDETKCDAASLPHP